MSLDKAHVVLREIFNERVRQNDLWGEQDHPHAFSQADYFAIDADEAKEQYSRRFEKGQGSWADILLEEFYEAIDEAKAGDIPKLREELIQVAAVCVNWIQCIDRNNVL